MKASVANLLPPTLLLCQGVGLVSPYSSQALRLQPMLHRFHSLPPHQPPIPAPAAAAFPRRSTSHQPIFTRPTTEQNPFQRDLHIAV